MRRGREGPVRKRLARPVLMPRNPVAAHLRSSGRVYASGAPGNKKDRASRAQCEGRPTREARNME